MTNYKCISRLQLINTLRLQTRLFVTKDVLTDLIMGNKNVAPVYMIGDYKLFLDLGLYIVLKDVCYSAEMARNIISFNALYIDGFDFKFNNGSILVYKNDMFYFKASPCRGILETTVRLNDSSIYNVDSSKDGLDKTYM